MTLNIILYHKFKYNQLNLIQIQIVKTLILKQSQNIFGGNENHLHVVAPGSPSSKFRQLGRNIYCENENQVF